MKLHSRTRRTDFFLHHWTGHYHYDPCNEADAQAAQRCRQERARFIRSAGGVYCSWTRQTLFRPYDPKRGAFAFDADNHLGSPWTDDPNLGYRERLFITRTRPTDFLNGAQGLKPNTPYPIWLFLKLDKQSAEGLIRSGGLVYTQNIYELGLPWEGEKGTRGLVANVLAYRVIGFIDGRPRVLHQWPETLSRKTFAQNLDCSGIKPSSKNRLGGPSLVMGRGSGEASVGSMIDDKAAGTELGPIRPPVIKAHVARGASRLSEHCSRDNVRAVTREHSGQLKYCYSKELQTQRDLEGKVIVRWIINRNGSVKRAEIASSTLSSPKVEGCLLRSIKRWRFDPLNGRQCTVNYPFWFKSAR